MQSENTLDTDLTAVKGTPSKPRSTKANLMIGLHAVTFLLGLSLLFYLFKWYWPTILESIAKVGYGFLFIVLLNLARHFLRAAAARASVF